MRKKEFEMTRKRNKTEIELAEKIISEYEPKSVEDMENALKDIFAPMFEAMLNGEMNSHLGYKNNSKSEKNNDNRRNGYSEKTLKTSGGKVEIAVPRDRNSSFESVIIPKYKKDVSSIESKVLTMYAKGLSQRDIADVIEDIYGFEISHQTISEITNSVIENLQEWQNRPLKSMYAFVFIDCMYVTIRKDYESKKCAIYTILGYDIDGKKDILGLWINETESKHTWMQIFDELKNRGVEDILFISMDGVSGLETGAKSIFPDTIIQRCIVHLIRNSIKYIPSKHYKKFTASIKLVYQASSLNACKTTFQRFKDEWKDYPGAVSVWERNFNHVEQLFNYSSAIRKIIYTTNAIESVNSSFRRVTKKGAFPSEIALLKLLYLRTLELYDKWKNRPVPNWSDVRNQLHINDNFATRISKFDH